MSSQRSDDVLSYEKSDEYKTNLILVQNKRLAEVRIWIIVNYAIFFVTAPTMHYIRWERIDTKGEIALIVMTI